VDGATLAPVMLQVMNGRAQATLALAGLAPGAHQVRISYSGDAAFAPSAEQFVVTVAASQPAGPRVVAAGLKTVAIKKHVKRPAIVLTFDSLLDPARAQQVGSYQVVMQGRHSHAIQVVSAVYDTIANTVTLRTSIRLTSKKTFGVTVLGTGANAVTGASGVPLGAAAGSTVGHDFSTTVGAIPRVRAKDLAGRARLRRLHRSVADVARAHLETGRADVTVDTRSTRLTPARIVLGGAVPDGPSWRPPGIETQAHAPRPRTRATTHAPM
jgi:hypothetical protein